MEGTLSRVQSLQGEEALVVELSVTRGSLGRPCFLRPQIADLGYWGGFHDWGKGLAKDLQKDPFETWDSSVFGTFRCYILIL